jgi:hypothetical protein
LLYNRLCREKGQERNKKASLEKQRILHPLAMVSFLFKKRLSRVADDQGGLTVQDIDNILADFRWKSFAIDFWLVKPTSTNKRHSRNSTPLNAVELLENLCRAIHVETVALSLATILCSIEYPGVFSGNRRGLALRFLFDADCFDQEIRLPMVVPLVLSALKGTKVDVQEGSKAAFNRMVVGWCRTQ